MKTYQDYLEIKERGTEKELKNFVVDLVAEHKRSPMYKTAKEADMYYRHLNPTIMRYQKIVYDLMGKAKPDMWSANHKIPCRYYFYFITQTTQHLLGNGVSFGEESTKDGLGKDFDYNMQDAAVKAMNGGVAFCFWNYDHVEVYSVLEFAPLYDEETGALMAGVRFWQIADDKPIRYTLMEPDGYAEYIQRNGEEMTVIKEKTSYKAVIRRSEATGVEITDGGNYEGFPVVPLYNTNKQSELVGSKQTLDAYDLMASALINNIDDANVIYWIIKNAGGMEDEDDLEFVQRLKTLHAVHLEGDQEVDAHTVNVPFEASETALKRLRSELFDDFMALDVKEIADGAVTATQIKAAYEPLTAKVDLFEAQVTKCIEEILRLAGIDDEPTYTRSMIVNQQEMVETVLSTGTVLPQEYVARKVLETLGDIDKADEILKDIVIEEATRTPQNQQTEESEEPTEE